MESESPALPRDPQLWAQVADYAIDTAPAWLWRTDGSRILWANAVGAALFGAPDVAGCIERRFDLNHPAVVEIRRLAGTLPPAGQMRLERLRGFGASFGRPLTCICSRVAAADGPAILVTATEAAGPTLSLQERIDRLFAGSRGALVVFSADGNALYRTATAQALLGDGGSPAALGIADLVSDALGKGNATGSSACGAVSLRRLGGGGSTAIAAEFATPGAQIEDSKNNKKDRTPLAPRVAREAHEETATDRRHPLRFVWQMDADGRFVVGSDEFVELVGSPTTAAFGRLWREIAVELKLDPHDQVARAIASRETWSGITVFWPVDDGGEPLPIEMSGLPAFDRDRNFHGYRGFGVCRDLARINRLARLRRERPIGYGGAPTVKAAAEPSALPALAPVRPTETAAMPEPVAAASAERAERPALSIVPAPANVVPFRSGVTAEQKAPSLSPGERSAFRELAQELAARLREVRGEAVAEDSPDEVSAQARAEPGEAVAAATEVPDQDIHPQQVVEPAKSQPPQTFEPALLDRIPIGVLIYRHDGGQDVLLYANRYLLELSGYETLSALAAVGLDKLFAEPAAESGAAQPLSVMTCDGTRRPVEGRLIAVPWGGASAQALILTNGESAERRHANALSMTAAQNEIRELKTHIESFKKTEADWRAATREAQRVAATKAEFVGKVSHEIRTPLNAITGFAEVMMAERFGPIGNERYREYLKDIHSAGVHLVSLLNDLLDLSKVETGQLDLSFANVSLNDLTQQCVGIMQPQASRARIIIRTSFTPGLPQVVADERSLRQIVLNLLSNSIRFTGPGGQVIVSTAFADGGEAVLRVRDTGSGMSEKDVEAVLEPFRQTAISGSFGSGGTGLGLPLTKALAEANRAHFSIKSAPNAGTLVEVAFPPGRVVAR